ncbi:hypothetical protein LSAT2_005953 [Lamellibrachia satsuma]|nr:hypothetical protein LSAT2_005953 [Lamellibrachia satsuma]
MVPVPAETDEQMLAALRVAQESASGASNTVTQAALHQLQSSPNITLSGEIAGQQIFVVTDPQQIEALQKLAQQQQQLQQQQHDLMPASVAEQQETILNNSDSNNITTETTANIMTTTSTVVDSDECLTTEVNTSLATVDTVTTATIHDHGDGPNTFTAE